MNSKSTPSEAPAETARRDQPADAPAPDADKLDASHAIRAWARLDGALATYRNEVRKEVGLTPLQLSILQLAHERPVVTLRDLRRLLAAHPATLGQAVAGLTELRLCRVARSPADRRVRMVALTRRGRAVIGRVPFAGPLCLGRRVTSAAKLRSLRRALDDAIELFGLVPWADRVPRAALVAEE